MKVLWYFLPRGKSAQFRKRLKLPREKSSQSRKRLKVVVGSSQRVLFCPNGRLSLFSFGLSTFFFFDWRILCAGQSAGDKRVVGLIQATEHRLHCRVGVCVHGLRDQVSTKWTREHRRQTEKQALAKVKEWCTCYFGTLQWVLSLPCAMGTVCLGVDCALRYYVTLNNKKAVAVLLEGATWCSQPPTPNATWWIAWTVCVWCVHEPTAAWLPQWRRGAER
jgi:hypothetical protein